MGLCGLKPLGVWYKSSPTAFLTQLTKDLKLKMKVHAINMLVSILGSPSGNVAAITQPSEKVVFEHGYDEYSKVRNKRPFATMYPVRLIQNFYSGGSKVVPSLRTVVERRTLPAKTF